MATLQITKVTAEQRSAQQQISPCNNNITTTSTHTLSPPAHTHTHTHKSRTKAVCEVIHTHMHEHKHSVEQSKHTHDSNHTTNRPPELRVSLSLAFSTHTQRRQPDPTGKLISLDSLCPPRRGKPSSSSSSTISAVRSVVCARERKHAQSSHTLPHSVFFSVLPPQLPPVHLSCVRLVSVHMCRPISTHTHTQLSRATPAQPHNPPIRADPVLLRACPINQLPVICRQNRFVKYTLGSVAYT